MSIDNAVLKNYTQPQLMKNITAGGEVIDELHIGGRVATEYLMKEMSLRLGMRVLDIGSGLGGPARFAASTYNCNVTGIDLSPDYCAAAKALTEKQGRLLSQNLSFQVGNALALPMQDSSFDAAYTIHVGMNIEDKGRLYSEVARVLKPGAVFGIYDVFAGAMPKEPPYPLPWSDTPGTSFLLTINDAQMLLEAAGFDVYLREDRSAFAGTMLKTPLDSTDSEKVTRVMGPDFPTKVANLSMAIGDFRCSVWQILARKN